MSFLRFISWWLIKQLISIMTFCKRHILCIFNKKKMYRYLSLAQQSSLSGDTKTFLHIIFMKNKLSQNLYIGILIQNIQKVFTFHYYESFVKLNFMSSTEVEREILECTLHLIVIHDKERG